jgi:large subunit ribosomal protein L10
MAVTRADKDAELQTLTTMFEGADAAILIDYKGINVPQVTELRRELRKASSSYRVVKNTVIRHAIKDSAYSKLVGDLNPDRKNGSKAHDSLRGMTGVAWSYEDPAAAAKIIQTFQKSFGDKVKGLKVKTGLLSGELIDGDSLSKVPGLRETQAMVYGLLLAPGADLYMSLVAPGAMIVALLFSGIRQNEVAVF